VPAQFVIHLQTKLLAALFVFAQPLCCRLSLQTWQRVAGVSCCRRTPQCLWSQLAANKWLADIQHEYWQISQSAACSYNLFLSVARRIPNAFHSPSSGCSPRGSLPALNIARESRILSVCAEITEAFAPPHVQTCPCMSCCQAGAAVGSNVRAYWGGGGAHAERVRRRA
jgi:hypothetical protein